MTSLSRLQGDLQAFLLRGDPSVEAHVVGTDRVPIATRLGIYHHAYRSRLVEALCSNYPALAKLLGAEQFAQLGAEYIDACDSRTFSVRHYGDQLSKFVKTPLLVDLARWEWTMADVFDAADATSLGVKALESVPPEEWSDIRLGFHPSMRRLSLSSNAVQVWKALGSDAAVPEPQSDIEPVTWLLWRHDLKTLFRSLSAPEAQMVDGAIAGRSFGDLCSDLCVHCTEDEAPALAARFLRDWVESGLIVEVRR